VHRLIEQFERNYLGRPDAGAQVRKSAAMRRTILEAAMDCLANYGYARTTTQLIRRIAHISRGTLLHHYPSRTDLIKAVIEYAFYKRMKSFVEGVKHLSAQERVRLNLGIRNSWQQLATREYQVYLELHMAARTDAELRGIFIPLARQYDHVWRENVAPLYPEWSSRRLFDLGSEFTRSVLEGLRLNSDIWNNPENEVVLVEFVSQLLIMLRDGKLKFPGIAPEPAGNGSARGKRKSKAKARARA
jgi:AcrR family transcriptional regulator